MSTIWLESIHLALVDHHTTISLLLIVIGFFIIGAILFVGAGLDDIVTELKRLNSFCQSGEIIPELKKHNPAIARLEERDDHVYKE